VICGLNLFTEHSKRRKLHVSVTHFNYGVGHVLNISSHYSAKQHSWTQICNGNAV